MLENYARIKDFPALPRLRMGTSTSSSPRSRRRGCRSWVGELYLELHRGTLTTQAKVKKLNREAEHRLRSRSLRHARRARGAVYPQRRTRAAWKTLLLNQFHDILPGSSIYEVYQDTHRELADVVETADTTARRSACVYGAGAGRAARSTRVLVANAGLIRDRSPSSCHDRRPASPSPRRRSPLPTQRSTEGLLVHDPVVQVPGLGWIIARRRTISRRRTGQTIVAGVQADESDDGSSSRTSCCASRSAPTAAIAQRLDKRGETARCWQSAATSSGPTSTSRRTWDAWDIDESLRAGWRGDRSTSRASRSSSAVRSAPRCASSGVWRDSRIVADLPALVRIAPARHRDATSTGTSGRCCSGRRFPLAVRTHEATFETMYGVVRRPTHRNTSWDAARFEVCAHRFADISEPGYGVALLNDGKYGHSAHGNVLGISLVRGPLYPDPFADEGEHHFTYSLFPHPGDWTEAGVTREAFALNSPLVVAAGRRRGAGSSTDSSRLRASSSRSGPSSRPRMGGADPAPLRAARRPRGMHPPLRPAPRERKRTNLLEEPEGTVEVSDGAVRLAVRPFEVVTLLIEWEKG